MKFAVVVPTLNAGAAWEAWLGALGAQTMRPTEVLVLDSESNDGTVALAGQAGYEVINVPRGTFDHGGTRQMALGRLSADVEIVVYMTQDAVLAEAGSLETLVGVFARTDVGVAYGRQLPRVGAGPIEAHARLFNYPGFDQIRDYGSRSMLGLRAAFCSDSFAAYRLAALKEVGGFPVRTIFGEDMIAAAKLLRAGYKLAYVAGAAVFHSHGYGLGEEFRRYFDIGAMHVREGWLIDEFGGATGEGRRFVKSELTYLRRNAPGQIPVALVRTAVKLVGYRVGRLEGRLPRSVKMRVGMNKAFWRKA